jgi:hypothetical protein
MDSRHSIVNNKQTSATNKHQHQCVSRRAGSLIATVVTVALTMIIGIGNGREGAGAKVARRGAGGISSPSELEISNRHNRDANYPSRLLLA